MKIYKLYIGISLCFFSISTVLASGVFSLKERIHHGIDFYIPMSSISSSWNSKRTNANQYATNAMNNISYLSSNSKKALNEIIKNSSLANSAFSYGLGISSSHVLWDNIYANLGAYFTYTGNSNKDFYSFEDSWSDDFNDNSSINFNLAANTSLGYIFWLNQNISLVPYVRLGFNGLINKVHNGTDVNTGPFIRVDWLVSKDWLIAPYVGVLFPISTNYSTTPITNLTQSLAPILSLGTQVRYFATEHISVLFKIQYEYRRLDIKGTPELETISDKNGKTLKIYKARDDYVSYFKDSVNHTILFGVGAGFHF